MYKLKYVVQNYPWGKFGTDSEVYNLFKANDPSINDENLPYAELWLGTHVSGPSIVESNQKKLQDMIIENPSVLGDASIAVFGNALPFLLKVLSVNTALSIQVHPNKAEAEFLHKVAPDIYKDSNHKPEMAIALTHFEALVGFRKLDEVTLFIHSIPQLGELIGDIKKGYLNLISEEQKVAALKVCYKTLMLSSPDAISSAITSLVADFKNGKAVQYLTEKHAHLANLFLKLNEEFPNDIGCFSVFIFNKIVLEPGEAVFLGENIPHAYLSGTAIECMACSDNVIRAGLTPKYKDIETLITMLNYNSFSEHELKFKSIKLSSYSTMVTCDLFNPPVMDFAVERITAAPSPIFNSLADEYPVASIFLVTEGVGSLSVDSDGKTVLKRDYSRGNAFFVAAHLRVNIQPIHYSVLFRAFANVPDEVPVSL